MTLEHLVKSFDDELEGLKGKILLMGKHVEAQLKTAVNALVARDKKAAERVIVNDALIDRLANEVDKFTVRLLALRQPVGIDLRSILAALKMAADLERIADYAVNVARGIERLDGPSKTDPIDSIVRMAEVAQTMLEDVLQAYSKSDVKMANEVWKRDDQIDDIYTQLFIQLRKSMKEDANNIDPCTSLISIGKCVERIGDHITNIAEHIYYEVLGEDYPKT